jgi:hypothetical protein
MSWIKLLRHRSKRVRHPETLESAAADCEFGIPLFHECLTSLRLSAINSLRLRAKILRGPLGELPTSVGAGQ